MTVGFVKSRIDGPAKTLVLLASTAQLALEADPYNRIGATVWADGWAVMSIDLPGHGNNKVDKDLAAPENALVNWRTRVLGGEALGPTFVKQLSKAIDAAVEDGIADPQQIVISGTSRGGYLALFATALEPRIRAALLWSPVTDLGRLTEFADVSTKKQIRASSIARITDQLAGKPIWVLIGNNDLRVGTAATLSTMAAIAEYSEKKGVTDRIIVQVLQADGHEPPAEHESDALRWLLSVLSPPKGV